MMNTFLKKTDWAAWQLTGDSNYCILNFVYFEPVHLKSIHKETINGQPIFRKCILTKIS